MLYYFEVPTSLLTRILQISEFKYITCVYCSVLEFIGDIEPLGLSNLEFFSLLSLLSF